MSGHDGGAHHQHRWTGWRAEWYSLLHRNPPSNRAVVAWAELRPDERALDVGCGPGAAVRAAARGLQAGRAAGVDPSPDMIRIARRRSRGVANASFSVGTAEALPFPEADFDVAWAVHSSHHWTDPEAGLREIGRVLRPGGRLLVVERDDPGRDWGIGPARAEALAAGLLAAGFVGVTVGERTVGRSREFVLRGTVPTPTT